MTRAERTVTADLFRVALAVTETPVAEAARSMASAETIVRDIASAKRGLHVEKLVCLPKRVALRYLDMIRAHIEDSTPTTALPLDHRTLLVAVRQGALASVVTAARSRSSPGGRTITAEEYLEIERAALDLVEEGQAIALDARRARGGSR